MSQGARIPVDKAMTIAEAVLRLLAPHAINIEICGSLRRAFTYRVLDNRITRAHENAGVQDVGDIDIVVAPKLIAGGLFGENNVSEIDRVLDDAIQKGTLTSVKRGERMRSFIMQKSGISLEVKSTPPETFGVALAIHTGPAEFSHALVTHRAHDGALPPNVRVGGDKDMPWTVFIDDERHEFDDEKEFITGIGLPWMPPHHRHWPLNAAYAAEWKRQ